MKTKSQPRAAGEAVQTFPKLYRCRDSSNGEHCLRKDDSFGQRVLNITLSGHLDTEPNQAEWAAFVERACNSHAALAAALQAVEGHLAEYVDAQTRREIRAALAAAKV